MTTVATDWDSWLSQVPTEQRSQLISALKRQGSLPNGHNKPTASSSVEVLSTPLDDFMYPTCPPFVDTHNLLAVYNKLCFRNNLLVKGPKGDGKTLSFIHYAHETKTPLVTVECAQDTKKRDLIGTFLNLNQFQLGPIPQAIDIANTYGRCIIVFEEVNALTPQTQKVLNALLDFRKFVTIPQVGRTFRLREGAALWCTATMNPSVYGGTYDLNEDLRSRWIELEVGYPQHGQEKEILKTHFPNMTPEMQDAMDKCIRLASDTRQQGVGYALSTRDLVDLLGLIEVMSVQDALQLTACKFEGDDRETVIKRISSSFAGVKPRKHWGAAK